MPATLKELGIDRLSADERLALVGEIWDSFADGGGFTVPESHVEELRRREAAHAADPAVGGMWDEVKSRIANRKLMSAY